MSYHGYIPIACDVLEAFPFPNILEIGIDKGQSLFPIVQRLTLQNKNFQYSGIDILVRQDLYTTIKSMKLKSEQRIIIVEMNSLQALPTLRAHNVTFDLILLDGDHNYQTISKELEFINDMTHKNSFIICDDYYNDNAYVDEYYERYSEYATNKLVTKQDMQIEKHGVRTAIDEFLYNNNEWRIWECISVAERGDPVVLHKGVLDSIDVHVKK